MVRRPYAVLSLALVASALALALPSVAAAAHATPSSGSLRVVIADTGSAVVPAIHIRRVGSTYTVLLRHTTTLHDLPSGNYAASSVRTPATRDGAKGYWIEVHESRSVDGNGGTATLRLAPLFVPYEITSDTRGTPSVARGPHFCPGMWNPKATLVLFCSPGPRLVPGLSGGYDEVYAKSPSTGAIRLVSSTAGGAPANGESSIDEFDGTSAAISPDGEHVLFDSKATNLVAGVTDGDTNVYTKDLSTGAVSLVSSASDGTPAHGDSEGEIMSPDGARVMFLSNATNLGVGSTASSDSDGYQYYVKTLATGTLIALDTAPDGTPGNAQIILDGGAIWNAEGTQIAFFSAATNLGAGNGRDQTAAYVETVATGKLTWISDLPGSAGSEVWTSPVWSPDGSHAIFADGDSTGSTNAWAVWSRATGRTTLLTTSAHGTTVYAEGGTPLWNSSGTAILFREGDNDLWVLTIATGALVRVDASPSGTTGNGPHSTTGAWSPDGASVAFVSSSTNLGIGAVKTATVLVKNIATGRITRIGDGVSAVSFSPDGRRVAYYSAEPSSGPTIATIGKKQVTYIGDGQNAGHPVPIAWSPNGKLLLFTDALGGVYVQETDEYSAG